MKKNSKITAAENESRKHRNTKKIALIAALCVLAGFFLIGLPALTVIIYQDNFGSRFETAAWMAYSVDDFDGLEVEACTFPSNDGQLLAGYQYSKEGQEEKGVVVIAHGFGGGGHNSYMDVADYFTSHGYLVFAYDATGNDKSEGKSVEGLPQGVIDLDYALDYVQEAKAYQGLPVVLFGHSWGGYSAGSVLNCQPKVKAAVLAAGFDCSLDLIRQQGEEMAGSFMKLLMPYFAIYERLKFGNYAAYNAMDGFANTDAGIMVIHSKDDTMVLPENGYDKFYRTYGSDPRFCFIEFEDRGHQNLYYTKAAMRYKKQLNEAYTAYVEANGGVYSDEIKQTYMEEHLDKSKCWELDDKMMGQMVEFYDSYCADN